MFSAKPVVNSSNIRFFQETSHVTFHVIKRTLSVISYVKDDVICQCAKFPFNFIIAAGNIAKWTETKKIQKKKNSLAPGLNYKHLKDLKEDWGFRLLFCSARQNADRVFELFWKK